MLTENECKIAAALLDLAGDVFGNHGCNDFWIDDHAKMTDDEKRRLDLAVHQWNGDPDEHEPDVSHNYQSDFCLMHYLADKLRRGTCRTTP